MKILLSLTLFLFLSACKVNADNSFVLLAKSGEVLKLQADDSSIVQLNKIQIPVNEFDFRGLLVDENMSLYYSIKYVESVHPKIVKKIFYVEADNQNSLILAEGTNPIRLGRDLCFINDRDIFCRNPNGELKEVFSVNHDLDIDNFILTNKFLIVVDNKEIKYLPLLSNEKQEVEKLDKPCVPVVYDLDKGTLCRSERWGVYYWSRSGEQLKTKNFVPKAKSGNYLAGFVIKESFVAKEVKLAIYNINTGKLNIIDHEIKPSNSIISAL